MAESLPCRIVTDVQTKTCNECRRDLPLEAFSRHPEKRDGRHYKCKECSQRRQTERIRSLTPEQKRARTEKARRHRFKVRYGITVAEYEAMHAAQDGKCAMCGREETKKVKGFPYRLAVDHDHVTGKVRALLCQLCNRGIGCLQDDPAMLRKAADYVERHRALALAG